MDWTLLFSIYASDMLTPQVLKISKRAGTVIGNNRAEDAAKAIEEGKSMTK